MASKGMQGPTLCLVWALSMVVLMSSVMVQARRTIENMNVIDKCWRPNPNWRANRHQLATCSVGYAGKMTNNAGRGVTNYEVTDHTDDPMNPRPGTLRYGVTSIRGKVWITFRRDMNIQLAKPLLISSFTTIDGRGVNVHIANGACLLLQKVTDVIIHGIRIHDCKAQGPGPVMGPDRKIVQLGPVDGDAIRMVSSSKIWIDHNTLQDCQDGLIDVTRGSTDITISNNWFKFQDKVMLLGHDDGFILDKNMKVTVTFNHFGPSCHQRMPRIRFGYAHVTNNLYLGWGIYAIGGSMNPSIKSQANLFIAPQGGNKEITWGNSVNGKFKSVQDVFENGASFSNSVGEGTAMRPNYRADQAFQVADGRAVRPKPNLKAQSFVVTSLSMKKRLKPLKGLLSYSSRREKKKGAEMGRRILNDALRTIVNAEKRGFASAELKPVSNVIASFLQIMKYRGYIKDFEVHDPQRVGRITVALLGRVKDCRAITYRQDIKAQYIESYKTRALPTHQWGYVVITTPNGVLDHEEAIRQKVGGQVLGYFY